MSHITDREVLGLIIGRYGTPAAAAEALGLNNAGFYYNWRERGIPRGWRRAVWLLCKERGIHFDESWCLNAKNPRERAALAKSLQSVVRGTNGGQSNGKATGKKQQQRERRSLRPVRRAAAGRSVPEMAR